MRESIAHRRHTAPTVKLAGVCVVLCLVTLGLYWQTLGHDFINYDDDFYLTNNLRVQSGFTLANIEWAFRSTLAAHWHPLTWLSHMLDFKLFGMNPGGHHIASVLFHCANSVLLFLLLSRMTSSVWRAAFVAALFAVHPLHVESVAWASERKDVLSAFFWLLTMVGYLWYVRKPGVIRYLAVAFCFACSLMSKGMAVTLPFVLILMDIWPLGRIGFGEAESWKITFHGTSAKRLALEKIPLLLMSVGICIVIVAASQENQSLGTVESLSLGQRLVNAPVAYVVYMGKLIWPGEMSVLYLLDDSLVLWEAIAAAMVLLLISGWAVSVIRKHPFFFVGWFWFVGALVPVIGLVQVGKQFIADRYTYIPSIGFCIVLAWGAPVIARKVHLKPALLIGPAIASLAMCILFTGAQIPHWKNSQALFRHALEIDENNYVAHNNLGIALAEEGETEAAISHYQTAIGILPEFANAYYNMALARIGQERPDLAVALFSRAIDIRPDYVDAWNNLGNTYFAMGQLDQAISHYQTALKLEPGHEFIRRNLEMAEEERKNFRIR